MKIEEEKLNKAVITSQDIVSDKSFIRHVYYDEDGAIGKKIEAML